jgi:hypothetical protein
MVESVGENCIVNFPGTQSQAQETTMNLLKQVHLITSGQEIARKCCVLTKETLGKVGATLQHATEITETLCTRNWHFEVVSYSYETA